MKTTVAPLLVCASLAVACGGVDGSLIPPATGGTIINGGGGGADAGALTLDASTPFDSAGPVGPSADGAIADASGDSAAPPDAGDLAGQLGGLTGHCAVASSGKYATDEGSASTVDV